MNSLEPERIDLWYADITHPVTDERTGKPRPDKRVIHITPSKPVTKESLKRDVLSALKSILNDALYYYAVAVIRKENGDLGYRTFIPKTMV